MIHRTFRSLDEAPKLVGFTIRQWAALIAGAGIVLGVVHLAQLPVKAAITLLVFTVGLPGALAYVSESGGLQLGQLLVDVCRWRLRAKRLLASSQCEREPRGVLITLGPRGEHRQNGSPRQAHALTGSRK
ncbi:MAG: PrgI family protein [Solirubrobacteraceae bacterium]